MGTHETNLTAVINADMNDLFHSGVPNQKWYVHKFGDWERHAKYARGMPNPETKEKRKSRAEKRAEKKQAKIAARQRQAADAAALQAQKPDLASMRKNIQGMDTTTLNKEAARLQAEKNYTQALIDNINKTAEYKAILDAPELAKKQAFQKKLNTVWDATKGLRGDAMKLAGNVIKASLYDAIAKEYGEDKARVILNGMINIPKQNNGNDGNGGGGKKKGGGGNNNGMDLSLLDPKDRSAYILAQAEEARARAFKTRAEADKISESARSEKVKSEREQYNFNRQKAEDQAADRARKLAAKQSKPTKFQRAQTRTQDLPDDWEEMIDTFWS